MLDVPAHKIVSKVSGNTSSTHHMHALRSVFRCKRDIYSCPVHPRPPYALPTPTTHTRQTKRLGGGFGGKETRGIFIHCAAAVPAYHLRRPVRLTLDRDEDMQMTGGWRRCVLGACDS